VAYPAGTNGTADGLMADNDGRTIFVLNNTGAAARVVTFQTPAEEQGLALAEHTVSVAAGATVLVSELEPNVFNQPSSSDDRGKVYLNFPAGVEAEVNVRVLHS
jgi:hypothetical protein